MRSLMSSFTSARTFREGSVGLLFLLGLGTFGLIFFWLNRLALGHNSYQATIEFADAGGMQKGSPVRYRGVKVGSIAQIKPKANAIEVEIEIAGNLVIPRDSTIEANQSGLISESTIDITPKRKLLSGVAIASPMSKDCNPSLIICNGSHLKGDLGISTDALIRQSTDFAAVYSTPQFYHNVNRLLETSADAAANVATLTRELQSLSKNAKGQLSVFSGTAMTLQRATNQLTATTTKTANQFGTTASDFSATSKQASRLMNNVDSLLTSNRSALVSTLNNMTETSSQLRQTVASLSPMMNRLTQGELLKNLETLSANAAEASASLRTASKALDDPKNIVLLQQTLDAARVTFANTQKITSDVDELTGDPAFRKNLLQLVTGLSKLVSSTKEMQNDVQVSATINSMKTALESRGAGEQEAWWKGSNN